MGDKTVTASIGVASYRPNITPRELIENVDNALYEAKWRGRNKVCLFKEKV
ncbi:MAG: diguanylate cyclase [Candidatus Aureabacteria bacterium]|nr:diguanylate cyclase [Candidatus Auribacterota bacterium]